MYVSKSLGAIKLLVISNLPLCDNFYIIRAFYISISALLHIFYKGLNELFIHIRAMMIIIFHQIKLHIPDDSCFFFTTGFSFFWRTVLIDSSKTALSPY